MSEDKYKKTEVPLGQNIFFSILWFVFLTWLTVLWWDDVQYAIETSIWILLSTSGFLIWRIGRKLKVWILGEVSRRKFQKLRQDFNENPPDFSVVSATYFEFAFGLKEKLEDSFRSLLEDVLLSGLDSNIIIGVSPRNKGGIQDAILINRLVEEYRKKTNQGLWIKVFYQDPPKQRDARNPLLNKIQEVQGKKLAWVKMLRTERGMRDDGITPVRREGKTLYFARDSDGIIPLGTNVARMSAPFLLQDDIGFVTFNNVAYVEDGSPEEIRFAATRFNDREVQMEYTPLVATGRGSGFSEEVIQSDLLLEMMERDIIYHKKYKHVLRLSGDDKITVFVAWLLGLKGVFLPDVTVICFENFPEPKWDDKLTWIENKLKQHWTVRAAQLSRRYSGNSSANRPRMLALGDKLGKRERQSLRDQGYSVWTPLYGPFMAIGTTLAGGIGFLQGYVLWILWSRTAWTIARSLRTRSSWSYVDPKLEIYKQFITTLVKIMAEYAPHIQSWVRQNITQSSGSVWRVRLSMIFTLLGLLLFALVLTGGLKLPTKPTGLPWGLQLPDAHPQNSILDNQGRPK